MKTMLFLFLSLFGLSLAALADTGGSIPLKLTTQDIHDATLRVLEEGVVEIRTTGGDPYVFTEPLSQPPDPKRQHVLAFEFFSTTGASSVQVFLNGPISEEFSEFGGELIHSEGWSPYAVDLKPALDRFKGTVRGLRIDFGNAAGKVIQIRGLRLRPQTEQELKLAARRGALREEQRRADKRLRAYLEYKYPCRVAQVTVDDRQIKVTGNVARERGGLYLAEAPIYADIAGYKQFPLLQPLQPNASGNFAVTVPRQSKQNGQNFDRLLSRWAVVRRTGTGYELLSHARYPDAVRPKYDLPEERPRNKKGIGGLAADRPVSDLDDLGLSAATVNILLNGLFSTEPGTGRTPFVYAGETWYTDDRSVERLDRDLLEAAKRRLVVSAIILVGQGASAPAGSFSRLIAHPDADPSGIFVMPYVSSQKGLTAYAAALDFLAQRYSRPDNKYGRIHHWIMHNEVNAGWVWTNAGDKTALLYMDLYHKSMRVAQLIARQYNAHSRAFISLEHHWTQILPKFYAGRELLELLTEFSKAEGDFDWAIAFHPYPQNLFDPRVWADDQVNFTFDTPKITFKNLEVLDAWVKQPRYFYLGKRPRIVHLTEQGLNSMDYSEKSLRDQAAGMSYAWNKYKNLDTIEVFDYHNWVDNRGEGGLRIGLRRFPDDRDDPLGKKPIWFVYQALGTEKENEVAAPYKAVIGIKDWSEVRYHGEIK